MSPIYRGRHKILNPKTKHLNGLKEMNPICLKEKNGEKLMTEY